MHTINIIAQQIVELSAIKSAYNHYLASQHAVVEVENTTLIKNNRTIISGSLKQLHLKMEKQKAKKQITNNKMIITDYKYSPLETSAIHQFNSDKRFTITE